MGNGLLSPQSAESGQSQGRAEPQDPVQCWPRRTSVLNQDCQRQSNLVTLNITSVQPCCHQRLLFAWESPPCRWLSLAENSLPTSLVKGPGLHTREASALDLVSAFHPRGRLQPLMPCAVAAERETGTNETGRTQGLQRPLDPEGKQLLVSHVEKVGGAPESQSLSTPAWACPRALHWAGKRRASGTTPSSGSR